MMRPVYRFVCLISLAVLACAGAEKHLDDPWKKAGADQGLRQAFERAVYKLAASGHGTYQGSNPAQKLDLEFNARGARLKASDPRANVGFTLTGYGYGSRLRTPAPAKLAGTGSRVEYRRGDITEWYANEPRGLEQGFTLAQRPGTAAEGEPLVIALGVSGGLRPALAADGGAVLLQTGKRTVLRYGGLHARDASGREVASRFEVGRHEIRLVIEDSAAEYPLVVDPVVTWNQESEVTASDGANSDYFGYSVSVSGSTAFVGAYGKNSQGTVYVFVQSGGTWTQQAELTDPGGARGDAFGYSVSVSGNTAVVGANNTLANYAQQGAAYVFVENEGTWTQQAELTASDGVYNDKFGYSVSVSGATAVVGAPYKTVSSNSQQGAAYVFVQSGGIWSQQMKLTASDGAPNDLFGNAVSVSGTTAVVGAYDKKVNSNVSQGAAYVFLQSGSTWSQQAELTASNGGAGFAFGDSVSVSGATAVVGSRFALINSNNEQGAAYVFVQSSGTWTQQAELTASDGAAGDNFGISVSVSGNTAVVGAYGKTLNSNLGQGAAYVFLQSGGTWNQQAELIASDGASSDEFGWSVSLSGNTVVAGAPNKNSSQGAAYVFVELPSTTTLSASPNPAIFGSPVTLTATVSPSSATGTVTFYDGTTVLGIAPVSNGVATFTTTLLASGVGSLTARYEGGGTTAYAASLSAPYTETVNAQVADGFIQASGSPFAAGSQPYSVAVGDFNGDGIPDLAVANSGDNTVTVLLGNGSGGFTAATGSPFAAGSYPDSVAVGDFNGDGIADLVVANLYSNNVTILLGNGSGSFTPAGGSPFAAVSPSFIAVADFNGDGIADLAVTNGVSNGTVTVLLGNGSAGFTAASGSPITVGNDPVSIAVGAVTTVSADAESLRLPLHVRGRVGTAAGQRLHVIHDVPLARAGGFAGGWARVAPLERTFGRDAPVDLALRRAGAGRTSGR